VHLLRIRGPLIRRRRVRVRALALGAVVGVGCIVVACASGDDSGAGEPAAQRPSNARVLALSEIKVKDLVEACVLRTQWSRGASDRCLECLAAAPNPSCDCSRFREFAGACAVHEDARRSEGSCTDAVDTCARTCGKTDCGCLERCYELAPRCRVVAGVRDGCVAQVCAEACR